MLPGLKYKFGMPVPYQLQRIDMFWVKLTWVHSLEPA